MTYNSHFCPYFHEAVELIGQRWTGAILREMLAGATRFTELRHAIPDLSDRMLAERLKGLEAYHIVERRVYPETPVRVEYQLTDRGRALGPVLEALGQWANRWGCSEASAEGPPAA
jgi:DNA-binding HxlR family transcriptional regulator